MLHRHVVVLATVTLLSGAWVAPASAQGAQAAKPPVRSSANQSNGFHVGGFALVGSTSFTAKESFDAVLGTHSGPVYGGGAHVGLPWGGLFAEVSAWRYRETGERVFVLNGTPIPLGISTTVIVTPIELSAGWQFHFRKAPKLRPYLAAGYTSLRYEETSEFATSSENIDKNFGGYHLYGGAEYKITRWLGAAGEVAWSTVPNALGDDGVSKSFGEDNLGGTAFRFKITIGR